MLSSTIFYCIPPGLLCCILSYFLLPFALCPGRFPQLYLEALPLNYIFRHCFHLQKHSLPLCFYAPSSVSLFLDRGHKKCFQLSSVCLKCLAALAWHSYQRIQRCCRWLSGGRSALSHGTLSPERDPLGGGQEMATDRYRPHGVWAGSHALDGVLPNAR